MPEQAPTFYLTTPIYYVNARPHIGHAYTTLVADTLARRHRLLGHDVFFLTGTDEHGQKIERSATAAGIPPAQFTTVVSDSFRRLWHRMGITYTGSPAEVETRKTSPTAFALPHFTRPEPGFIRTTDPDHIRGVRQLFSQLRRNGFIYKGTYTGQYCVSDEAYVEGPPGIHCPDCGRLTETVSEENFYFRLSAFQLPLLDLIESDTLKIQPPSARNEVLSFLRGNTSPPATPNVPSPQTVSSRPQQSEVERPASAPAREDVSTRPERSEVERPASASAQTPGAPFRSQSDISGNTNSPDNSQPDQLPRTAAGAPYLPGALKDLSISRTSFHWGVPVPGDEKHVIYVWLDALANYMTAVGYGSPNPAAQTLFEKFWPANLHLVGKEITRFHCIYWPAFLLALNPALHPTQNVSSRPEAAQSDAAVQRPAVALSPAAHRAWAAKFLPKEIVANGWLLFDNSKMSKSKGNVVRAETILTGFGQTYLQGIRDHNARELKKDPAFTPLPDPTPAEQDLFATDVLRYFLLREIPFGQDGSFSFEAMITRYNADLANGYGNLVSRVLAMIGKYFDGSVPDTGTPLEVTYLNGVQIDAFAGLQLGHQPGNTVEEFSASLLAGNYQRALLIVWDAIAARDEMLSASAPWKMAANPDQRPALGTVLYTAAESIRILTALIYPILPFATAKVWKQLGFKESIEEAAARGDLRDLQWGGLQPGTKLGSLAPIFPRADKGLAQTMADLEATPPPNLLDVANDEHDATRNPDHTAFREAPLADVAPGTVDQTALAEARSETTVSSRPERSEVERPASAPAQTPGTPVPAEPTGTFSTDPAAPPRTSALPNGNPIAQVGGSYATTTATPAPTTPTHVSAEPSGIFATPASTTPVSATPAGTSPQITIDDFAKVELRVAEILVAERIPKADKLLRLEVDLGPLGRRQILSGIAEWYPPESLVGRRIVVIANLAPRKMRGLDSHGMLLAASDGDGGKPILATFAEHIAPGTRLK